MTAPGPRDAPRAPWRPTLGAWLDGDGVRFRAWAPSARRLAVRVEGGGDHPLARADDGTFTGRVPGIGAGARYRYVLDEGPALPDVASRFQPEGVHGPSEVIDPSFAWTDAGWTGLDRDALAIYELHVGTFSPEGTFAAAARRLPELAALGVTAVQLLPVADFAGDRNWGYDAVDLFAPARCYGRPEELRALVDVAHGLGLGVILDVVYNHFGPDGAYQGAYAREYFNPAHHTPWGAAINLDAAGSDAVRAYFIESALHWLHEYHVDGFRLDATHALVDDGPRHFLAEYAEAVHERTQTGPAGRALRPVVIAEDHRNLNTIVRPAGGGPGGAEPGWGLDAVFADDLHHAIRRLLAGDHEGYFQDYAGTTEEIATALERGWIYTGEHSAFWDEPRGTDPAGLPPPRFVHCLQNHDQVGNRAFGNRLTEDASAGAVRAATALLLCDAATVLLFMGEEWGASTPFQFFTNHHAELGALVTEGRRNEFRHWSAFRDPASRERIPDPQDPATFARSHLDWLERRREPHASMLLLHRALLALRRRAGPAASQHAVALDDDTVALRRPAGGWPAERGPGGGELLVIARLRGSGAHRAHALLAPPAGVRWERVLTTEDAGLAPDPTPVALDLDGGAPAVRFSRPGAVVLHAASGPSDA